MSGCTILLTSMIIFLAFVFKGFSSVRQNNSCVYPIQPVHLNHGLCRTSFTAADLHFTLTLLSALIYRTEDEMDELEPITFGGLEKL